MKTRPFIGFSLGLALALTAPASASAAVTTNVNPMTLGSVDAVLQFCRHITRGDAAHYWKLRVAIFGKPPKDTLEALRATTLYKDTFNEVHDALIGAPQDWAHQSCLDLASSAGI